MPVTGVMEDQIRAGLAPLSGVEEVRIDWRWTPAWRPADITDSGRERLRAIGFAIWPPRPPRVGDIALTPSRVPRHDRGVEVHPEDLRDLAR